MREIFERARRFLSRWLPRRLAGDGDGDDDEGPDERTRALCEDLAHKLGCSSTKLAALSQDSLETLHQRQRDHALRCDRVAETWRPDTELTVDELLNGPVEAVSHYAPTAELVRALRRNPERLRAIVDHGMTQLSSLEEMACWAALTPTCAPVALWLEAMCAGIRAPDHTDNSTTLTESGDDMADASMLDILSKFDVSAVCGYYFAENETGVHCLECTADTTCVMCMTCFRTSPCRFHNYRLTSTTSGGMCDCGNPHMWKPESFCTHHGAHATPQNPVDSLPEAHRGWVAETIRGLIHLASIVLQIGLTFRKAPWTTPEMNIGGPTIGERAWMTTWLTLASEQLNAASACGDGSRRLLTNAWIGKAHTINYPFQELEKTGFCSDKEDLTCLEILFLFDLCVNNDDDDEESELPGSTCYQDVMKCVANCLPDSVFRLPYAIHMCQYAEKMSNSDELGNLCVQVLNSVAVSSLMERPLGVSSLVLTDTIVHRMMSSVLYLLTTLVDEDRPDFASIPGGDWMVPLVRSVQLSTFSLTFFSMCVGCSHAAALATVLSRTCFKAFCSLLLVIQCNSDIYKDPDSRVPTNVVSIPHWLGCAIVSELWRVQLNIREILAALTDSHGDSEAACDILALRRPVVDMLRTSVALDDPRLSEQYSKILSHCRIESDQAALTWDDMDADTPDPGFTFAARLLHELQDHLSIFFRVQRAQFCKANTTIVLHPKDAHTMSPVYEYELLKAQHAVSTSNTVITLTSFVLRAWMMELGRRNGYWWSHSDHYSTDVASAVRLHGATPPPPPLAATASSRLDSPAGAKTLLDLLSPLCQHSDATNETLGGLLDALVMPIVLISQVEQGLWRRNDHNVAVNTQTYLLSGTKCFLEGDIFFLQVLTACFPAEDFTLRILQRFTYPMLTDSSSTRDDDGDEDARCTIAGYARYLRLILTIVQDTCKNCNTPEFSQPTIDHTVANLLSGSRMPHSRVLQYVSNRIPGEFQGESIHGAPQSGGKVENMIRETLEALAVGEHTKSGLQFRLKSTAVWRQHVDLYYPMVTDDTMPALYEQYRSIETLEYLRATQDDNGLLGAAPTAEPLDDTAAARIVQVPPTTLRSARQYAALLPPTRALLHTDALLLPCFFVLHLFNENAKRHLRGEPDAARVSEPLVVHAVTALHLCVQDCEELSAALMHEHARDAPQQDGCATTSPSSTCPTAPPINWPAVDEHLLRTVQQKGSFEVTSRNLYLPLPSLAGETGLRHKLQIPVSALQMPQSGLTLFEASDSVTPLTTAEVLHELRERYMSSSDGDRFSVARMIDHVLVATGLAQFCPQGENDEAAEEERRRREEASRRQKRLKERQSKLLQRMRMRCAKTTATSASASTMGAEEATQVLRPLRPHESGYLHTKLLMDLATLECCVCRLAGEEPLMMLAHTSASGSLYHLRRDSPGVLLNGRTTHGHFHTCGHAAHMTCIEKVYSRLARQWSDGTFFEGRYYLGPSEFLCPMCMMICNTVCVCPTLSSSATNTSTSPSPYMTSQATAAATGMGVLTLTAPAQPVARESSRGSSPTSPLLPPSVNPSNLPGETLFEELRRCSVNPHSPFYAQLVTRCDVLVGAVAAANIGLNTSESAAPLVLQEDPLQSADPSAWELAETIRCVVVALRLAVELSGIGQCPTRKDMISILALLTSIHTTRLEASYGAVHQRFHESGEGMCLLVLECLRTPRHAAQLIQRYTIAVTQSSETVHHTVEAWLGATDLVATAEPASLPQHAQLVSVLRELLCMSYLKLLLVEEPAHLVLRAEEDNLSDVVMHVALETAEAREDTLLRHLSYLLRHKVDPAAAAELPSTRADVLRLLRQDPTVGTQTTAPLHFTVPQLTMSDTPYESPGQWAKHLLTAVLHQEDHYTQILTDFAKTGVCSECGKASRRPVLCCLCHRYFCLQPTESSPELYTHAQSCCGGLGLFLVVRGTSFIFVDTVATRVGEYPSIYTDDFGEADMHLARGAPLTRNTDDGLRLLIVWITNRWGVESRIVKHSYAGAIVMTI